MPEMNIDDYAKNMKAFINENLLPGREKALFETKLEEAVMWAKKGLKNQVTHNKEGQENG